MFMIQRAIDLNASKYYVVRIGAEPDLGTENTPSYEKTNLYFMVADPFGGVSERVKYKMFIDPFVEKLPEGKKDLDYFLLYYSAQEDAWVAFDIESLPEPRTWDDLREASGLEDL